MAAHTMENKKRTTYGAGQRMVPFVVEAHGRLGEAASKWLAFAYRGQPELKRELLAEVSAHVQAHTASMVIASAT